MIPDRLKNIFAFIDFLESNKKAYLETYVPLTNRVLQLSNERSKLRPSNNYKEKQQYDIIQKKMEEPCSLIDNNVVKPILQRLLDLEIWDGDETYASIWNNNTGDIHELTQNFTDADIEEIKSYKQRYLDFRTETKTAFLSLALMFDNLDEVLKMLFDFFKDAEANEFEPFETKTIPVDNIYEAVEEFKKGNTKFSLPIDFFYSSNVQQSNNQTLPSQQIEIKKQREQKRIAEQQEAERQAGLEIEKQSSQVKTQQPKQEMEDVIKLIIERGRLRDFLCVPDADEVIKDAFWHDENDMPIDCNIYHPKYGYQGCESHSEGFPVNINPVTGYRDSNTGKYVYCRYYLQMLCTADGVNFTNKDSKKVIKVDYTLTNRKRLAENETDFENILLREVQTKKLRNSPEILSILKLELLNHVEYLKKLHKANSAYEELDIDVLALAEKFLGYLKKEDGFSLPFIEAPNDVLLSTIDDYLFDFKENISKTDYERLAQALKQYFEVGSFPSIPTVIQITGKVNKKKFGWALKELYRKRKNDSLPKEYVRFGKENLSIFKNVTFDEDNYLNCTLYKYYTTKSQ